MNASSEPGHVVCNGMSNFARNARNANSAIVVSVQPEDFGSTHVLAGMSFQRRWEQAAYQAANRIPGFAMPVQRLEDFYARRPSTKFGSLQPCAKGAVALSDLNSCLPEYVLTPIKEGLGSATASFLASPTPTRAHWRGNPHLITHPHCARRQAAKQHRRLVSLRRRGRVRRGYHVSGYGWHPRGRIGGEPSIKLAKFTASRTTPRLSFAPPAGQPPHQLAHGWK